MSAFWLKYTILLPADQEEGFSYEIVNSPYTLGWTEPQIEVIVTDNGYDYQEQRDLPVHAYLFEELTEEEAVQTERLRAYLQTIGAPGLYQIVRVEKVKEENESWKEAFEPVKVGEWTIAPSWLGADLTDEPILWIDPGAAFGTGYHGTTQDILRLLQEMPLAGKTVIDVGAGSGILSLFCIMQGAAKPVYALDINPESEVEIRNNLRHNRLDKESIRIIIGDATASQIREQLPEGSADLIIINIGGDEDLTMLPLVARALAPEGHVLFSGIVEWSRQAFVDAVEAEGFTILKERRSAEWITLLTSQNA